MMDRVKEFQQTAENSLGYSIPIMSTSWGPPAYLKSNNDKSNGGTLKFEVVDGEVQFNYGGFAAWWGEALDVSKLHGIAHHLYHGAEEENPFLSENFSAVGAFHPEIPHFQTEYLRGEWFQVGVTIQYVADKISKLHKINHS